MRASDITMLKAKKLNRKNFEMTPAAVSPVVRREKSSKSTEAD